MDTKGHESAVGEMKDSEPYPGATVWWLRTAQLWDKTHLSLFVWLRVPSWLNCFSPADASGSGGKMRWKVVSNRALGKHRPSAKLVKLTGLKLDREPQKPFMKILRTTLFVLVLLTGVSVATALTPGPTIIRQCPGCKQGLRELTIGSGNSFGAKWWTDGKPDAPMLPMLPELVKCPDCRWLFWMADAKKLSELEGWAVEPKWANAKSTVDPVEDDYLAAARAKGVSRPHQLYARKRAWWLANDAVRERPDRSLTWSGVRRENLEKLSALINEQEECEIILKAEIARELGQFETCAKLLARTFKGKDCESYAAFVRGLALAKKSKVELLPSADKKRP